MDPAWTIENDMGTGRLLAIPIDFEIGRAFIAHSILGDPARECNRLMRLPS
jgi:hypothetical protein